MNPKEPSTRSHKVRAPQLWLEKPKYLELHIKKAYIWELRRKATREPQATQNLDLK